MSTGWSIGSAGLLLRKNASQVRQESQEIPGCLNRADWQGATACLICLHFQNGESEPPFKSSHEPHFHDVDDLIAGGNGADHDGGVAAAQAALRSEERRVGKECRS